MTKLLPIPLHLKLPARRAGLPEKVFSFYIAPLDPTYSALAGRGTFRSIKHQQGKSMPVVVYFYPVRNNAPLGFESRYSGTGISDGVDKALKITIEDCDRITDGE